MKKSFKRLTEDYSHHPVPAEKSVSGLSVALILVGIMITVPVFLAGSELGLALGITQALPVFFAGGFLLALLGCLTAAVGAKTRLSTYMIIKFSFGEWGAHLVNIVLIAALLGWSAVTIAVFGQAGSMAVDQVFGFVRPEEVYMVIGAAVMVTSVIFGFQALQKLSQLSVPLLIVFLLLMLGLVIQRYGIDVIGRYRGTGMPLDIALSVVVGTYIVGVVLTPDLARYLHGPKHGIVASVLSTAIGLPLILATAATATVATGEKDLVTLLIALGLGIPSLIVLGFATWTSNATNYYVAGLAIASFHGSLRKWKCTALAGIVSLIMAVLGIGDHIIQFLLLLGLLLPPICGIYIADFFFFSQQHYRVQDLAGQAKIKFPALIAWLMGGGVGYYSTSSGLVLTSVPALDSLLVSFVFYCLFQRCRPGYIATGADPLRR